MPLEFEGPTRVLLDLVLRFRFLPRLPLHIVRRVRAAVLQGLNVIDHVASARSSCRTSCWTRVVAAEGTPGRSGPCDPAARITGTGLAADGGSRVRSGRPAARTFSPARSTAGAGSPGIGSDGQEQPEKREGKADQVLRLHEGIVCAAPQTP
jgi:hypothetical protein